MQKFTLWIEKTAWTFAGGIDFGAFYSDQPVSSRQRVLPVGTSVENFSRSMIEGARFVGFLLWMVTRILDPKIVGVLPFLF